MASSLFKSVREYPKPLNLGMKRTLNQAVFLFFKRKPRASTLGEASFKRNQSVIGSDWKYLPAGILLVIILGMNIFSLFSPLDSFEKLRLGLVKNSSTPEIHLDTIALLIERGDYSGAKREISIVEELVNRPDYQKNDLLRRRLNDLKMKLREIDLVAISEDLVYWQKIASEKPDYPDAWAKLAELWFKSGKQRLAELAIQKAIDLDPIREEFKEIRKTIFEFGI